ncbi:mannose-1-phosphate guanylyltransferase [Pseudarthrobacter oxydans]|jgi:mannose-1-phosphate guanylyltransferase|uniref:Mannose-1-phosphate guanylyltransferase n=1 Tax=Pseudarthrobacter oxydans TaxID=1671 RepID=A0AAW8N7B8_PSEOX|nr:MULTISPECIES: mannose-1-phosphate guanylyltransferase [Pseudarthrobacter]MDV2977722.1 mannose-1-phosphate guanylyltransferase [Actinomycetes bacterium ARC8]WHP60514.1 mannose-1-phosphate guanylyltransferase [Arthrobacter sp. KFRI-F3372]MDR6791606.1 mannose-1-phosphate guanylyltransferase [Pseudarthrobacter oxydans]MDR7162744.1 mannose-1-phosphate guanylyltransferase [Pseudarthrobacter oxydans]NSX35441.1 NTP transferase domain-containing protein [Pseudarthrobacter oxydans]
MSTDKVTSPASPLDRFIAVIPAGGVGTRLWPLSRAAAPKFLHDLTGSGSTLLRATYDRLQPLAGRRVLVVTGKAHRDAVCRQLPEVQDSDLVLESEPKDSAAAIGLAAAILHERDPDTIMGSFAADQVISPDNLFQQAVREAIHTAAAGKIVTIGIKPTHPSTGFGYIRSGQELHIEGAPSALDVVEFVEKPDEEVAQQYVDSGNYVWNAGMFVAPVALLLKHLEANQPELFRGLQEIAQAWDTPARDEVTARVWPTLPKIAIDYAVAEPAAEAGDVAVVPGSFRWDDVGDFASVGRLNSAKEVDDVTVLGEGARVFTENSSGVVVTDTKRVIALIGIQDVVIVDTPDALLVTTMANSQRVKAAVDALKASGDTDVL